MSQPITLSKHIIRIRKYLECGEGDTLNDWHTVKKINHALGIEDLPLEDSKPSNKKK